MKQKAMMVDKQVYYRLIALWIFCEAVLGGIIHGLKLPVSGLIVGSCSVICISLMACYVPARNAILKATVIVAIFKMLLSPHSPPTAYVAVFFQGLVGQVLFSTNGFSKTSCILLGVIALAESALQRILVLTIVFGNDVWKAINDAINKLTGQANATNYSFLLGAGYLLLHILAGLAVGSFAYHLTKHKNQLDAGYHITDENDSVIVKPKRRKLKLVLLFIWIVFLALFLQSWLSIGNPILSSQVSFQIIFRSFLIVLTWYFVISPMLLYFTSKWLQNRKHEYAGDVQAVAQLLPATQNMVYKSWQLSASKKGWQRIKHCLRIVIANTLRKHD